MAGDLVDALRRLEYRGYDSAGVATVENGHLDRRRAEGKLKNLELRLSNHPLQGHAGIGHTRWATHGKPVERNAHPHMNERVAVVHNGIIENFQELRDELTAKGHEFQTETDTETVLHLVSDYLDQGKSPTEAAKAALQRLRGAFALAIIFAGEDNLMIGARHGPPLAIGHGQGEMYLGSDAIALAPFTDTITYLEDGDWAVLTREKAEIFSLDGRKVSRPAIKSVASSLLVDKGNYRHFMAKEIHEQPEVISHTLAKLHRLRRRARRACPTSASIPPAYRRSRSRPAARPTTRAWSASTGWSATRAFPSRSTSPPSSATASRRCRRAGCRCSSRSRARRPTRWRRCATASRRASASPRSSTCARPPSPASPTWCCRRWPAPRSASPPPRPSPASCRCWRA